LIAAEFPATFAFKTSQGNTGVLRIDHYKEGDKAVKLEYKLIEPEKAP
jgi:hypothetical protein